ncbi:MULTISPECIES: helix-turn-helix domain-containing protein, partial [unclassified Methanoculleus]|uniref:helix-turn-helix domain-containing protein n=2 Tax=Methanoculleus TaxID=45989 RepID=UPI0031B9FAD3
MIVSYKYRAYPDATTAARLNGALDTCRWLYNKLLEECTTAREHGFTPTMRGMQAQIVTLKEENPFLKGVYSKARKMLRIFLSGTTQRVVPCAPDGQLYPLEQHRRSLPDEE